MMAGKYLLDTNILVDVFKSRQAVIDAIDSAEELFTQSNILGKLYFGAYNSVQFEKHFNEAEEVKKTTTVLPVGNETAHIYGKIKSDLKRKGRPIPDNDIWIAASAIEHDLMLLTRDKHFSEIERLQLKIL